MKPLLEKTLTVVQLKELLEAGESITQNEQGFNALHAAVLMSVGLREKVELLLQANVNVNARDCHAEYKNTPLNILIANEQHEYALDFIGLAKGKIDFKVTDYQGKTNLITAAKINSTRIALALLEAIGNELSTINMQDEDGMSALHYACLYGNETLALALLQANASPDLPNREGKNALDCTVLGEKQIAKTLRSIEIDPNRDEKACFNIFRDSVYQPLIIVHPYRVESVKCCKFEMTY